MFFGDKRYDPAAAWRREPATERQMQALRERGVRAPAGMTRGAAGDLISAHSAPDDDELAFLGHFGVRLAKDASQLDARTAITRIIADPANREKWGRRPATAEQRAIIKSVDGKVRRGLTHDEAQALINGYGDDEGKAERLEAAWETLNRAEDRKSSIRDTWESLNDEPSVYGLKATSLALVRRAVEDWERESGSPLETLERDIGFLDALAERIRRLKPDKATTTARERPELFLPQPPAASVSEAVRRANAAREPSKAAGIIGLLILIAAGVLLVRCMR